MEDININIIITAVIALIIGALIAWLITKLKLGKDAVSKKEHGKLQDDLNENISNLKVENEKVRNLENDTRDLKNEIDQKDKDIIRFTSEMATKNQQLNTAVSNEKTVNDKLQILDTKLTKEKELHATLKTIKAQIIVAKEGVDNELTALKEKFTSTEEVLSTKTDDFNTVNKLLATANANNKALEDKLQTQKKEIEDMGIKFNTEFENIAAKILKANTKSFSELNETKIKDLLEPLGKNIREFKEKVDDVYVKEAKERFSLGEKVSDLVKLNKQISEDTINLTHALKGEAKTQGNWGEMILESILEKSGLRKDEEYFMEHQLTGEDGKPLRSDSEGKKMRPDAVIKYPDNRNVIIDSKVSLNAFTRYLSAANSKDQKIELDAHVTAIKMHITTLSTKGYDDYNKALDFVLMFIPSEPAYIAAMQGDSNLWNYAYDKRILLMNPTNLITALKLIVDLWKREYQNQNAIEIANRGSKLYDKFVGFVTNLEKVGKHIDSAKGSYEDAHKQLTTGNDNLVLQATKLKNLGLKTKKELPGEMERTALIEE